ncbi:helix-turn-helix transcriptional regulator [Desulfonatronum thioautotrophicum]|uniref:helix-turn-helix transcriptional regulator n=1 Tax=Desulfonatronum thioautotrophicum TaxID=617001 RepID=UPI0005EB5BFF|nr:WYL domain-containing protein [Desulfonatronum thioautotrophicum]
MPPKHDQFASPAQKLLGLFGALLFTGREYSLTGLAGMLGCSKQTVLRMMESIERSREVKIESRFSDDGQRWYKARTPRIRPNVSLTPEGIQHLVLCRDMVMHLLPKGLRDEIENTIARSTAFLPNLHDRGDALVSISKAMVKGAIDYTPHQETIERLFQCIRNKTVCELTYQSSTASHPKTYSYAPLRMVSYREALYVSGAKVAEEGSPEIVMRTILCVHRIKEVVPTIRVHALKEEDEGEGQFGFMCLEPFRVQVKFAQEVAAYVSERTWSEDQVVRQLKNGKTILEFTARSRPEVVSWVLSFGRHALLLKPKDLREDLISVIEAMQGQYQGKK